MSRVLRKPGSAYAKAKAQTSLDETANLISAPVPATRAATKTGFLKTRLLCSLDIVLVDGFQYERYKDTESFKFSHISRTHNFFKLKGIRASVVIPR